MLESKFMPIVYKVSLKKCRTYFRKAYIPITSLPTICSLDLESHFIILSPPKLSSLVLNLSGDPGEFGDTSAL